VKIHRIAGVALLALAAAPALAAPKAPAIGGVWVGKYICAQGITRLTLTIDEQTGGKLKATFRFGPAKENPTVPPGSYRMTGSYKAGSRGIDLKGVEWVEQPLGYIMVDLKGAMTADGLMLSGQVPTPGCSIFQLERQAQLIS
jgi:hypothetical protein